MKKAAFTLSILLNLLAAAPIVMAMPDPFATLVIWPVGTPEGAEGPIVATSPADLIVYNNDHSHILDDLWLFLVINEDAYDNLVSISTNTSLTFIADDFVDISGEASPSTKIPPSESDGEWPGIEPDDQYNTGSLRDVLGIPRGASMYYAVGDLDSSSGWVDHGPEGLNKGDPEYFTLIVTSGGDWKVLALALGHTNDYPDHPILNVMSPYTRSTITIVSELGTVFLVLASFSALGLYKIRHKLRKV